MAKVWIDWVTKVSDKVNALINTNKMSIFIYVNMWLYLFAWVVAILKIFGVI
jgi:hypothetical protein